ncbi:IucA/IucC family protein [Streptomyces sp. NPDC056987]|uniref:IucA/IucC family protein n=1 Tax=Streptomyces sp. NPDC056987 TaxID=3345988 RepID=UPI003644A666
MATPGAPVPEAPAGPAPLFAPPELNPAVWERVAGRLLAKTLGEFAYEEIIEPVPMAEPAAEPTARPGSGGYAVTLDAGETLTFRAERAAYGHWRVDPGSVRCDGRPFTDPLRFLLLARRLLGLDGTTLGHLVRELTTTLAADAKLDHTALSAAELAGLDYAELEGHQTGHPWIVLNKGRVGFSATDADRWAPEGRTPATLPWIAVSTTLATYRGVASLATPDQLYALELDDAVRARFDTVLRDRGLDPAGYLYLPVHPWQWDEVLIQLYAPAIARGVIVPLPTDGDLRLPQQSIRTFLNVRRPDRHTVKLPLSILNTLVWRGLPTERTLAAPAVTAWMHGVRDADPFLRDECRVILLGEVASVTVEHPLYDHLPEVPYQYKELLGTIWREPLQTRLAPGERARTLASLIHTDPRGRAFTAELVERSGLAPQEWLRRLFSALLPALLHFLYRYGTVFSPHGENAIVVFDDRDVPVRLAMKDFVDDVNLSARPLPEHDAMPADVKATLLTEEPAFLPQFIHSGLFIGVFRYLAPLCADQLGVPDDVFWSLVRAEILRYQARFPELKERFETFDLLTPRIERLCLNRNRLHLDGYRDRSDRPHAAVHGTVPNPLAVVRTSE